MAGYYNPDKKGSSDSYKKNRSDSNAINTKLSRIPSNFRPTNSSESSKGRDVLRGFEQNAISHSNGQQSFYSGTGRSSGVNKSNKKNNTRFLGSKKTLGAMGIIIALIGGGGAFLSTTHSLLVGALDSAINIQTASSMWLGMARGAKLMNYKLDSSTTNGSLKPYSEVSDSFRARLTKNGYTVSGSGSNISLAYEGRAITPNEWDSFYRSNVKGREAFDSAYYSKASNFYDSDADEILYKYGIDRNIYKNAHQTSDAEANMRQFDEIMTNRLDASGSQTDMEGKNQARQDTGDTDADGNRIYNDITESTDPAHANTSSEITTVEADTRARSFVNNIAGKVQNVTNWTCTAYRIGNLISVAVAANQIQQTINYFAAGAENPSKTKAGFGSESAINALLNFFTTNHTVTIEDYNNPHIEGEADTDGQGSLKVELGEKTESGSALESEGLQSMLGGRTPNAQVAANYSIERTGKLLGLALLGEAFTSAGTLSRCNVAQGSVALVSLAVNLIPGVGEVKIMGQYVFRVIAATVTTVAIGTFLGFMIPTIAKTFYTNPFEGLEGKPAGEAYASGASALNSRIGRSASALAISTKEIIDGSLTIQQNMVALDSEVDRYNRSPFDITSRNTFLGSIVYNLMPLTLVNKTSSVNTLLTTTSNSIAALEDKAMAFNIATFYSERGNCPNLDSISAEGDIYCHPIVSEDPSTMNTLPNDPEYLEALRDEIICDADGDCEVIENSTLAKFISFCDNRDSPFGIADSSILNALSKGAVIANFFGSWPIIGDALDIVTAFEYEANMKWATGAMCVASTVVDSAWNKKLKYLQRYINDMRILENMDAFGSESSTELPGPNTPGVSTSTTTGNIKEERTTITIPGLQNNYKIAWVSDLHLVNQEDTNAADERYGYSVSSDGIHADEYLDTIINYLNNGGFDAVIFGGDMLDYYSPKNAEMLANGLNKLTMPWFYIYGSIDHDQSTRYNLGELDNGIFVNGSANASDVIDLGEFKIVGLNNSSEKNITSNDLNPVANTIQSAGKPVILATHVPFASQVTDLSNQISGHSDPVYYWDVNSSNWNLNRNSAMQNFLNDNIYSDNTNVKAVLAGHVHTSSIDSQLTSNVKQHIFQNSFNGNIGVITVTGDNVASFNTVDYDIPNRNPVVAYEEKYTEEHPLDNSPSGYLARISGLSKEDAGLVLDVVAYYNYIDGYDADSRLAMNGDASDIKSADVIVGEIRSQKFQNHPMIGDGEANEDYTILISQHIIYADLRNRNYVA